MAAPFIVAGLYLLWQWRRGSGETRGQEPAGAESDRRSSLAIAASTYALVFLAEVGDKTQLAVLGLAATNRALPVFLGAAAALTATTLLGGAGRAGDHEIHPPARDLLLRCIPLRRHGRPHAAGGLLTPLRAEAESPGVSQRRSSVRRQGIGLT